MLELFLFVFFGVILVSAYSAMMALLCIAAFVAVCAFIVGFAFNKFLDFINPFRT